MTVGRQRWDSNVGCLSGRIAILGSLLVGGCLMAFEVESIDELLEKAEQGDSSAVQRLLASHRNRLKNMVRLRLDRRVVARIDPSDIVQEALAEAAQQLPQYASERPVPFYPWLRQLAWKRLERLHEQHVKAQRRTVGREERL